MEQRAKLVNFMQSVVKIVNYAEFTNNSDLRNEYCKIIKAETMADKEFAGFRRAFFRAAGLGEYVSADC
ncbi:MAG: hypothetical protein GY795_39870 [Desulfobacterales bacterium]|nr:hypothetical protein [Desulfobacterales bacterium]